MGRVDNAAGITNGTCSRRRREPELTAESYTAGLRQRYMLMMGAAAVYIVGYGIVFIVLRKRQRNF